MEAQLIEEISDGNGDGSGIAVSIYRVHHCDDTDAASDPHTAVTHQTACVWLATAAKVNTPSHTGVLLVSSRHSLTHHSLSPLSHHDSAQILHTEWPRGGTVAAYKEKLVHPLAGSADAYALPCSYVLVVGGECVG